MVPLDWPRYSTLFEMERYEERNCSLDVTDALASRGRSITHMAALHYIVARTDHTMIQIAK